MKKINTYVAKLLTKIKSKKPLIHHITNFVVMNDTANITLHIGALPVMAHAYEEMKEMTGIANALVINIGTLSKEWVKSMFLSGRTANNIKIPIVLDPVGAGATKLRTITSLDLLNKLQIAVVRGNSGEIGALSGAGGEVKGVESVKGINDPEKVAQNLAKKYKTVVAITGKRDIVANDKELYYVDNGHQFLSTITGTGCMATTLVAVFCSVEKNYALATAAALSFFGLAGEIAAKKTKGPASFKIALLDAAYNIDENFFENKAKIIKVK